MCAVTHKGEPFQLAFLIKKSLDDLIGTQQRAYEATVKYQYRNINFSLVYVLIAESSKY